MKWLSPPKITTMAEARSHRTYALAMLMLVYAFNFIDRRILTVLQTPIKEEFGLSDAQLGLLTGLLFALLYTFGGIPLARIADSTSRKTVLTVSLTVWSGFTAISGLVTNYWQLALARMGVGLGEAGGSPPALAMISDLYEPKHRGRALAVYSAGLYIGTLLGNVGGGWLSDTFDWRTAFMVVGLPGIVLAIMIQFTMHEPIRGLSGLKPSTERVTFIQAFRHLWRLKSFRFFSIAAGIGTFVTYGLGDWMVPFLERSYGMTRTEIGFAFGMVAGIAGAIGTIGGGIVGDLMAKRDQRWQLWIPMWGKLLGGPIFILGLLSPNPYLALACYGIGLTFAAAYLGPTLATTHSLVPAGMRAMASAVAFLIASLIGLGFGPLFVGMVSDFLNDASACNLSDVSVALARSCPHTSSVLAALQEGGFTAARSLSAADLSAAYASGFQAGGLAAEAGWTGKMIFEFRNLFPSVTLVGIGEDSLRWGMIICVAVTYPLSLLWHLGARLLNKDHAWTGQVA